MIVQPLLCRLPLLPGESLTSLLARLAKENNYEPRNILSSILWESGMFERTRRLGCPSQTSQFECISALTSIRSYELYKATANYFTGILTPPENEIECLELAHDLSVPLLSISISNKQVRPEYASQFCPQCLKIAAYHRLIWFPLASAACLEHECLLVNSCPRCRKRVTIQDIIEVSCSRCKTNLNEAQTVSVGKDNFGLFTQGLIQSWLMKVDNPKSTVYSLPPQMPRDLYRVVDGLRFSIMQINQDWPLLHQANIHQHSFRLLPSSHAQTFTPYQSYCLYATACKGIIDWPSGFHLFLTAYRNREKKSRYRNNSIFNGVSDEFGNLYVQWLNGYWKQPSLEFVQESFDQYLFDNHTSFPATVRLTRYKDTSQFIDNLRYISVNEAKKLLDVTHEKLRLMIRSGRLKSYTEKGKSWATLVKREDVLELRNKWDQAIELKEVINWLGLSKKVVIKLVHGG